MSLRYSVGAGCSASCGWCGRCTLRDTDPDRGVPNKGFCAHCGHDAFYPVHLDGHTFCSWRCLEAFEDEARGRFLEARYGAKR